MSTFAKAGYAAAGLTNIGGILAVSSFFTSEAFHSPYPGVFGEFGALMIMVWGLAYWSVINRAADTVWPAVVFAIEKAVYVAVWAFVVLPSLDQHTELLAGEPMVKLFYNTFGLIDLAFGLFFAWAAINAMKKGGQAAG